MIQNTIPNYPNQKEMNKPSIEPPETKDSTMLIQLP
jgi:hypothetical protein